MVVSEVRGTVPEDEGTTQCRAKVTAHHHRVSGLVQRPVLVSARIGAGLQRPLGDRRIDVVLLAPNVSEQAIHRLARANGVDV